MYLWKSQKILISKSCGGGCRKLVRCCRLLCKNWFHSQCIILVLRVVTWFPCWSNTLDFRSCVCIVGLLVRISLSGLHYWVVILRLVILSGRCMNF